MSKQNNSETNEQDPASSLRTATTTVKTAYARMALLLLACNMLLTGYAVVAFQKVTNARVEQLDGRTAPAAAQPQQAAQDTSNEQGSTPLSTREIETPTGATEDNR